MLRLRTPPGKAFPPAFNAVSRFGTEAVAVLWLEFCHLFRLTSAVNTPRLRHRHGLSALPFLVVVVVFLGCATVDRPSQDWVGGLQTWGMPGTASFWCEFTEPNVLRIIKYKGKSSRATHYVLGSSEADILRSLWSASASISPRAKDPKMFDGTSLRILWKEGEQTNEFRGRVGDPRELGSPITQLFEAINRFRLPDDPVY